MDQKSPSHPVISYRTYVITWAGLIILTGITIYLAVLQLGRWSTLTTIFVASLKAGLVFSIFMNLRYEERILKIVLFVVILTLAVIIGLTFLDVGYR